MVDLIYFEIHNMETFVITEVNGVVRDAQNTGIDIFPKSQF